MKYRIEYQDFATHGDVWYIGEAGYPSEEEAMRAIRDLIALGGRWVHRAYRVRPIRLTAPTHIELVRLVERLSNDGEGFALWSDDEGAEAILLEEDEIAAAVPGGPVRRGFLFGRPIQEAVRELLAWDHEAAAQERERVAMQERERVAALEAQQRAALERERAAALEAQQRAALERERAAKQERERAAVLEAQQRAAEQEHERQRAAALEAQQRAEQERERAARQERERTALEAQQRAEQERERAARQERERAAVLEAQQRAAHERERVARQEHERAAVLEAQQRAAQERERVTRQEHERVAALEAQQRVAHERERVARQERERVAALEAQQRAAHERERAARQERERATALEAQQHAAHERERTVRQERERAVALEAQQHAAHERARGAPPVFVERGTPSTKLGDDRDFSALAKLLRCGPWPEGMRASDLLTADRLPIGAHEALQELVGTARPTVRALGNALKRVQDKRIEGTTVKVTRTIDHHGFALWQVVNALGETSTTSERPRNAELLRGALTSMGYSAAEANYALSALRARIETEPLATLMREALGVLAQRPVPGGKPKCR